VLFPAPFLAFLNFSQYRSAMPLQNLVSVKQSKYSFRYVNILDVPRVQSTHYGKKSFKKCHAKEQKLKLLRIKVRKIFSLLSLFKRESKRFKTFNYCEAFLQIELTFALWHGTSVLRKIQKS
jgi:hypothetical protein